MTLPPQIAAFYTRPGPMTDPGALDGLLKDAPSDIAGMVAYIQNLLLHVHWAPAYRMRLNEERQAEAHTRSVRNMLALMQRHDPRPLAFVRTLYQRMVGNCRHFSTFGTALFRRAGTADPKTFGIFDQLGLWFVAGNLLRDFASLNGMEMLPWDVWGAMAKPDEDIAPEKFALFDKLAVLTADPDAHFAELRALYAADPALSVPPQVFNALRQRMEDV